MKPIRNILILVGVIVLLAGGFYLIQQYEPAEDAEAMPTFGPSITLFKTEKDSIQSVTVSSPEESYTLSKIGAMWVVNNDPNIKISQSRVDTLIYECATITVKELIAENVQELSQYGLDVPNRSVRIEQSDGTATTVLIGNTGLEGSVCYLMLSGETSIYTKSASGCDSLASPLSKLLDTAIYTIDSEDIGGVTLSRTGAKTVRLVRFNAAPADAEEPAYEWRMESPLIKTVNNYGIYEKLLANIVTQSAVKVIPVPEPGADYGLENPQAVYSLWNLDGSMQIEVQVGKQEGKNTYIKLKDKQTVYQVATDKLNFLSLSYLDLVDKLIHVENIAEVSEIEITGLNKTYRMAIVGAEDNASYSINDKKIEESKFKKAYQTVIGFTLDDFADDGGSGPVALTIRYIKKDGSETIVECLDYNDRNYLVHVNGKGNLLVRKKQVDTMFDQLDKTLAES